MPGDRDHLHVITRLVCASALGASLSAALGSPAAAEPPAASAPLAVRQTDPPSTRIASIRAAVVDFVRSGRILEDDETLQESFDKVAHVKSHDKSDQVTLD